MTTVKATTTMSGSVGRRLRVPTALEFKPALKCKKLRVEITERNRLSTSSNRRDQRVVFKIKASENIRTELLIIKHFTGRHHVVGQCLHLHHIFNNRRGTLLRGCQCHPGVDHPGTRA
jgi:hypothetical protein